ncbi:MAG: ribbon-helix-helix domain-containing protein [Bradymonadales bacterium]|nr:ribbon-helix-helix domain-containing protein [Bradymonadales bacterium]
MACTRRIQILMEPEEYEQIEKIARQKQVSVGELIRTAVRDRYLGSPDRRLAAAERIAAMNLPGINWEEAKRDIEEGCDGGLP